ncbi:hypothetical protein [Actinokineospora inagensis]|uniref:hypothetical protein n=1 Tax=Actinokineospora inagensis TaxID=103730 RepID=UPI00054D1B9D|nr:hypothetical protein [Actinokineospora inagensis]
MNSRVISRTGAAVVAGFAVLALSACAHKAVDATPVGGGGPTTGPESTVAGPPLDAEFTLARGDSVTVSGTGVATGVVVQFRDVTEDSRCKPGQACVWEGDATLALTLAGEQVQVHTNKQFPTEAQAGSYKVRLLKLDVPGTAATLVVAKA